MLVHGTGALPQDRRVRYSIIWVIQPGAGRNRAKDRTGTVGRKGNAEPERVARSLGQTPEPAQNTAHGSGAGIQKGICENGVI